MLSGLVLSVGACAPRVSSPGGRPEGTAPNRVAQTLGTSLQPLEHEAHAMLDRLAKKDLPAGLDRLALDLEAAAQKEGEGTRADVASSLVGDLFAARYKLTHDRADLERARARFARVARGKSDEACSAIAKAANIALTAEQKDLARGDFLAYERKCPRGEAIASVHASLAMLEPQVAVAEAAVQAPPPPVAVVQGIRRVVIDPGHGGSDPGAVGPTGLAEAQVTLDVSRRVADYVSAVMGVDVMLTRDADEFIPLEERAELANAARADLFVSIHCNSTVNPESHGVSVYVLDTASDQIAARVAVAEGDNWDVGAADPALFRILADLRLVGTGSRSMQLAQSIQANLLASLGSRFGDTVDLGIHPARFNVLVGARMPAVLVELSFVSNPVEEARMRDPAYRDLMARAIATGVAHAGL